MLLSEARPRPYRPSAAERKANRDDDKMRVQFPIEDELKARAEFAKNAIPGIIDRWGSNVIDKADKRLTNTSDPSHAIGVALRTKFADDVASVFNQRARRMFAKSDVIPRLERQYYDSWRVEYDYNAGRRVTYPENNASVDGITVYYEKDKYTNKLEVVNVDIDSGRISNSRDFLYTVTAKSNEAAKLLTDTIKEMEHYLPTFCYETNLHAVIDEQFPEYNERVAEFTKYVFAVIAPIVAKVSSKVENVVRYVMNPANGMLKNSSSDEYDNVTLAGANEFNEFDDYEEDLAEIED